jgi:hypothetical protein
MKEAPGFRWEGRKDSGSEEDFKFKFNTVTAFKLANFEVSLRRKLVPSQVVKHTQAIKSLLI